MAAGCRRTRTWRSVTRLLPRSPRRSGAGGERPPSPSQNPSLLPSPRQLSQSQMWSPSRSRSRPPVRPRQPLRSRARPRRGGPPAVQPGWRASATRLCSARPSRKATATATAGHVSRPSRAGRPTRSSAESTGGAGERPRLGHDGHRDLALHGVPAGQVLGRDRGCVPRRGDRCAADRADRERLRDPGPARHAPRPGADRDPRRADRTRGVLLLRRPRRGRTHRTTSLRKLLRRLRVAARLHAPARLRLRLPIRLPLPAWLRRRPSVPSGPRRRMPSMAPPSRWSCRPYSVSAADELARALEISPVTAAILTRRGHDTPDAARHFLAADERHDPMTLTGVPEACEAILRHIARGAKIVVHGDYDVDGVCSTAILVRALRGLCADPRWHIPSRADGYGLSTATVERLAAEGAGLLVTVDCAITATAEIARANELGLEVVVTDHHRPAETLPDCTIVHPALGDYPFHELCAAAVTHKLAQAAYRIAGRNPTAALADDLDLVGLATVADVVPLKGENRRLVREGLGALARTTKPGLRALMKISGVEPGAVTEHALGFRLAPRINAAGRLQRADAALELILNEDEGRAADIADELDILNRERQDTETRILFEAEAARAEHPEAPAYVLAGEGWHPGVIGIVASRMVERYHRPCVVIALDGDTGRGSGRSISAFDLHAGLAACSEHLSRFGGHRAAAGLEIDRASIDAFREAFVAHAASVLSPADLIAEQRIDAVVPGDALGTALAEELERLAPFGHGNPAPTLLVPAARVSDVRSMGEDGQHTRFTLSGGGSRARGVAFRTAARLLPASADERNDVAVRLELNEWKGTVEPRLVLRAICPTERASCTLARPEEDFLAAFERALDAKPGELATSAPDRAFAAEPAAASHLTAPPTGQRAVRDRRGSGFAGVAGDLLSSGERVLVVCADVSRRRNGLETLVAGITARVKSADCGQLALASWEELALEPGLAEAYRHVVALDPPAWPGGEALLESATGAGFAYLAWGPAEVEFALNVARRSLDMRAELVALYKELRGARSYTGEALERAMQGADRHPRTPLHAARLVRVLAEVGLVELVPGPELRLLDAHRTELERSPTYMDALERYAMARAYLERALTQAA